MQARYSRLNQALHWFTAACMFAILPLAWVMVNVKEGGPFTGTLFNWHKTLGAIVLIVTAFRIVWRFFDGPPAFPPSIAAWDRILARIAYWLFFAVLIFMPVTGLLTTLYGTHPTKLFDVIALPRLLPNDKGLSDFFGDLHLWGQWAVYALIALHLAAVVFHSIWGRNGVLGRMLPATAVEPAEPRAAPAPTARPAPQPQPQPKYARAR